MVASRRVKVIKQVSFYEADCEAIKTVQQYMKRYGHKKFATAVKAILARYGQEDNSLSVKPINQYEEPYAAPSRRQANVPDILDDLEY